VEHSGNGGVGRVAVGSVDEARRLHRWSAALVAGLAYLVLAVAVWWNVWTAGPRRTTVCGCGDSSFSLWFFEFAAHALRTGQSPLFTTLLWHPHGINVLDDASQLGLALPLAPVTWAGGAVLAMNVALTLAPFASALACYALVDHWGTWRPAAFVGGLVYGFSPLVVMNLAEAHLVIGFVAAPPLIVLCLDKLLFRDPRHPIGVGIALGLLITFQFFVSSEVLLITGVACAVGMALVLADAAWHRRPVARRWAEAWRGLASGAATSCVLLAYPVWFALDGPAHVSGTFYPGEGVAVSGASLRAFFLPTPVSEPFTRYMGRIGGYQGPTLSTQYLGIGMGVVAVAGVLIWRRDPRLRLFGAVGLVFAALAVGSSASGWRPWDLLVHLPLFRNVIPVRLLLVTFLCAGVLVATVADHVRRSLQPVGPGGRARRLLADAVALAVLAVAVVPPAAYLARTLPLTTQPVVIPSWFRVVAPGLGRHQVLLVVPVPFGAIQSSLTWQSQTHLIFAMAGGDGPGSTPGGVGRHPLAQELLAGVSGSLGAPPVTASGIAAVRAALDDWGVTRVVLPDQPGLPAYDQPFAPVAAAALITAALGEAPTLQARAWVWTSAGRGRPALDVPARTFAGCAGASRVPTAVSCVLAAPGAPS
jgi:hypothetical protein